MAITDIEISDTLRTGAPSIKYEGDDTTPANPMLMAGPDRYHTILESVMADMEAQLGRDLTDDEYNEAGKRAYEIFMSGGGYAEGGRINKAYGGIMGLDGRRQYGIGSWFQEKIMDPIKKNPAVAATAAALAVNQFGIPFTGTPGNRTGQNFIGNLLGGRDSVLGKGMDKVVIDGVEKDRAKLFNLGKILDTPIKNPEAEDRTFKDALLSGIAKSAIPVIGGLTAGLFADKIDKPEEIGLDRGTGVGIQNVRKVANLLTPQEGMAAGLNFLPDVAARKFSPIEMAAAYGDTNTQPIEQLADGGRTGYASGNKVTAQELVRRMQEINVEMLKAEGNELVQLMRESLSIRDRLKKLKKEGVDVEEVEDEIKLRFGKGPDEVEEVTFLEGVEDAAGQPVITGGGMYTSKPQDTDTSRFDAMKNRTFANAYKPLGKDFTQAAMMKRTPEVPMEIKEKLMEIIKPSGSIEEIYKGMERRPRAEGGLMNLGGMEKDYREDGGFVPIGKEEKADDVPARLSVNEFVFTADAVRGAGDGDVDEGAKRLQGIMKELEKRGQQGQDMIDVSERISEVMA
jgi:hypothetical protein